jgi:hypothetical protein
MRVAGLQQFAKSRAITPLEHAFRQELVDPQAAEDVPLSHGLCSDRFFFKYKILIHILVTIFINTYTYYLYDYL